MGDYLFRIWARRGLPGCVLYFCLLLLIGGIVGYIYQFVLGLF